QGPETAVVVGDGEIDCDEHGRILVKFHWDDVAAHTMRVRVSQNWASKGWGGMVIPRIGMEVIVEHLRGDPDKPIVTGCVYNGKNTTPNALPEFKTRSLFKTDSHQGEGYNEIRFEDQAGQEEVWLQAQKYLNAYVKDNETWRTEGSQDFHVSGSSSQKIEGEKDMQVLGNHREMVSGSRHITIGGSRVTETAISEFKAVGGDRATAIASTDDLHIGESLRVETGGAQFHKVGTSYYLDAGSDLVLQAGATISLNVGGNFIKIDGSGVTINGTLTKINSGGSAKKGKKIGRSKPTKPKKYAGPHAVRYGRSFKE
ncbi:type VI secretion system Vgr family protein, partial [Nereida sp. MMG025]|uniref:type VI secretion system Vgr family protein n=1 Tax=Nereida sp. MMG025 TaxID=2909981 RepID=UPI001F001A03